MSSREPRDVYFIPPNFIDTGTLFGGSIRLRNAVEAAVLAAGTGIPLLYLPLPFNWRLILVIVISLPLAILAVVGIEGDSLTEFLAHWLRFMRRRRIVTATEEGNLLANKRRHLRFIDRRKYRVVYYDDEAALPKGAKTVRKRSTTPGKLARSQTLYDLLPITKIENGIVATTDGRYLKILEIEPINFLLRSAREQRNVIQAFASMLKIAPVKLQIKSVAQKAAVNAYLAGLRADEAREPDPAVIPHHEDYIRFVSRLGSRDAVSRRFFVIFQYESPVNERHVPYAEIVSMLETTARNFRTYLGQCGNNVIEHENEDEFITEVFYDLLNRRTAVRRPLPDRIQDVLASFLAGEDATALDDIPADAFLIPPSVDFKHGKYVCMDGLYHAYLMIPADGYRPQVTAGWLNLLVNAGEGIDVDLFLERQPKERMIQKIGQQIRLNRSKIKDTSDTNTDFDDLAGAIRAGYFLKDGLANGEDLYFAAILVTVTAPAPRTCNGGWTNCASSAFRRTSPCSSAGSGRKLHFCRLCRCARSTRVCSKNTTAICSLPARRPAIRWSATNCATRAVCCWASTNTTILWSRSTTSIPLSTKTAASPSWAPPAPARPLRPSSSPIGSVCAGSRSTSLRR